MSRYWIALTVDLPAELDEGPLATLSSIVLGALSEAEVRVLSVKAGEAEGDEP